MSVLTNAIDAGARVLGRAGFFVAGCGFACVLGAVCTPAVAVASPAACKAISWNYGSGHLGVQISCYGDYEGPLCSEREIAQCSPGREVEPFPALGIEQGWPGSFVTPQIEANQPILFVSDPTGENGIPGHVFLCRGGRHSVHRWGCRPARHSGLWHERDFAGDEAVKFGPRAFGFVVAVRRPVCRGSRRLTLRVKFDVFYEDPELMPVWGLAEQLIVMPPCTAP